MTLKRTAIYTCDICETKVSIDLDKINTWIDMPEGWLRIPARPGIEEDEKHICYVCQRKIKEMSKCEKES